MLGEAETTIGMKYASTEDGRNAAVHERSHVAGSGDPKKAAETVAGAPAAVSTSKPAPGNKQPRCEPAWQPTVSREPAVPGESTTIASKRVVSSRSHPDVQPGERLVATGKADGRDQPGDKAESHISEEELGITSRSDDDEE
jgi:hypothetical protein